MLLGGLQEQSWGGNTCNRLHLLIVGTCSCIVKRGGLRMKRT
jgi:hypothetical protein